MALCNACETAADTFIGSDMDVKEGFAQTHGALVWHHHNHTCTDTSGCPCDWEKGGQVAAVLADPAAHGISDTATIDRSLLNS